MAGGFAVTKKPGTNLFAPCFHEAGFSVLAIDYRCLVESGGKPRQVVRIGDQLADWQAAIEFAASLPGVDPARLAAWAFSVSGGHMFRIAAGNPGSSRRRAAPAACGSDGNPGQRARATGPLDDRRRHERLHRR